MIGDRAFVDRLTLIIQNANRVLLIPTFAIRGPNCLISASQGAGTLDFAASTPQNKLW